MAVRTCTGCRRKDEKGRMLRVVRTDQGVAVDPRQVKPGRGAYVHHDAECMELAVKRGGLARTLRAHVPPTLLKETEGRKG